MKYTPDSVTLKFIIKPNARINSQLIEGIYTARRRSRCF